MKKINLRNLSSILSEKELKNMFGGSGIDQNANSYCYRCSSGDCVQTCYEGYNACLDIFSDSCPAGGFFWACD